MWDCEKCGTQGIAGSLDFCPTCRESRPSDDVAAESGGTPEPSPAFQGSSGVPPPDDAESPPSPRSRPKGKASASDND